MTYMANDLISIRINSVLILCYVLILNFQMERNFRASNFRAIKFVNKI